MKTLSYRSFALLAMFGVAVLPPAALGETEKMPITFGMSDNPAPVPAEMEVLPEEEAVLPGEGLAAVGEPPVVKHWSEMNAEELKAEASRLIAELESPDSTLTPLQRKRTRNLLKKIEARSHAMASASVDMPDDVPAPVMEESTADDRELLGEDVDARSEPEKVHDKVLDRIRQNRLR